MPKRPIPWFGRWYALVTIGVVAVAAVVYFWKRQQTPEVVRETISASEVKALLSRGGSYSGPVRISLRLERDGEVIMKPDVMATLDRETEVAEIKELVYPGIYDPPQVPEWAAADDRDASEIFPVTPISPKEFRSVEIGRRIKITPTQTKGLLILKGVFEETDVELRQGVFGELGRVFTADSDTKVVLSENRGILPKCVTQSHRFQVFAQPGKTYECGLAPGLKLTVRCVAEWTEDTTPVASR